MYEEKQYQEMDISKAFLKSKSYVREGKTKKRERGRGRERERSRLIDRQMDRWIDRERKIKGERR